MIADHKREAGESLAAEVAARGEAIKGAQEELAKATEQMNSEITQKTTELAE